ncbi:MAG: hypothetical protein ACREES_06440 [Stellaceae bacterium]
MKSKDAARVLREVHRMRRRVRTLPRGDLRRALAAAADKLETIAYRLEAKAAPRKRTK